MWRPEGMDAMKAIQHLRWRNLPLSRLVIMAWRRRRTAGGAAIRSPSTHNPEVPTMKRSTAWMLAAALSMTGGLALAQQKAKVDFGKREFDNRCAVCHAPNGKGNGPYAPYLKTPAPDLTVLSKRNGGIFPIQRVYEVIEGAGLGHGSREMPIWGKAFSMEAAEYYIDVPY